MDVISVVVPVYNVEKYLRRCVQSILSQSYKKLEIILVDDGAQDNSPQICDQLAALDKRIKVIHQENQGLGYARNTGLRNATGSFVTFVDSDDYIGKDHIKRLHIAIDEAKADIAVGFYTSVDGKDNVVEKKNKLKLGVYEQERIFSEILIPLIGTDKSCRYDTVVESSCCMNMYRLLFLENIWFSSEKEAVAEDQFFNIDCFARAKRVVVTDVNDYFYFINSQSLSRKYDKKRFARTVNYYYLLNQKAEYYGLSELVEKRIDRSYLMKTRVAIRHIVLSDMNFWSKRVEIQEILNHEITIKAINGYPINTYPFPMRILMLLIRKKRATGVYFLIKAREYIKVFGAISQMLAVAGVRG